MLRARNCWLASRAFFWSLGHGAQDDIDFIRSLLYCLFIFVHATPVLGAFLLCQSLRRLTIPGYALEYLQPRANPFRKEYNRRVNQHGVGFAVYISWSGIYFALSSFGRLDLAGAQGSGWALLNWNSKHCMTRKQSGSQCDPVCCLEAACRSSLVTLD